jgi:RNA polymerase sigma-70 factor (ECF subfamily)
MSTATASTAVPPTDRFSTDASPPSSDASSPVEDAAGSDGGTSKASSTALVVLTAGEDPAADPSGAAELAAREGTGTEVATVETVDLDIAEFDIMEVDIAEIDLAIGEKPVPEAVPVRPASARRPGLPAVTLVRFRDGDPDALGEVFDRYSRPVWSVAMAIARTDHLAQEAVQETFIRAWNAASSYDPTRDIGPWLLTIARYTALDMLRRELRPTRGGHEAEQDAVVESPGLDQAWVSWSVREALDKLGPEEQEIVRLSFFEDLTQTQISERLGLPLGTVKSRSHRAHRRLAELLAHVRDDPQSDKGEPDGSAKSYSDRGTRQRGRTAG